MLEMLKFLEGKKEFLEKDDLKEFFKDRYLNVEKFIHTNKNACEPVLYKYIFEPVYGLDDKMVEQVYVVKKVNEYNDNGQFLCIIDKLNKVLILNESVFIDNLAIYLKYLNITKEEKELLQEFMYANMEIMSNEKAGLFKETFLRDNIGQYKVLSAVSIHNELNNSLYKYIYDNIESFAEKMGIKDDCIEEVVNTSKDFFVGKRNYEKDVFMDVYRPKYSQIINDCQNRYKNTASYLYNYALNKASAMEKYANFINDKVNNADCVYSVNKYFNVKNIYVLKNAKKYLDENINDYKKDRILIEIKRLVSAIRSSMKTITVNGEKRKNRITFNYSDGTISMPDVKYRCEIHRYDMNENIEIKFGKKIIFNKL